MTRISKTSITHPLPIAAVVTPAGGAIGLAMCPGKRQPNAVTGPWDRDLQADMAAIAAFGARRLITLMELEELEGAAIPADVLKRAAQQHSLDWSHWPIVDLTPPDTTFERVWSAQAGGIVRELSTGGRIVVHCRGGRGRSGLVAARLLIELGVDNSAAFAAVRAAEPFAMETAPQQAHVLAYKPVHGPFTQ